VSGSDERPGPATLADLAAAIADAFPPQWAEPWDRVGLLAGDPAAPAGPVLVSLDASRGSLERARAAGARTLLTHHPAYLETPAPRPGPGSSGVVFEAVRSGIALVNAHTNLDRAPDGGDALPLAAGLEVVGPLESDLQPMDLVTVFAPTDAREPLEAAMCGAGAGRLGEYEGCAFAAEGHGRFSPRQGAKPRAGEPAAAPHAVGGSMSAAEERIEMVAPRGAGAGAAAAAREAHPYEEPLVIVTEIAIARGVARLGRLARPLRPLTLSELAMQVSRALGAPGTRFWGEPEALVGLVATASGSGGGMVAEALAAGASVLLTGELRYHTAVDALESGLAVIEAGHDASEWPLVRVLASAACRTPGLGDGDVRVDARPTLWRIA
jgi:dinuclear metal center YbgI/SA1388 family protein